MFRLVYCSHNTIAANGADLAQQVAALLAIAVRNNRERNVTGGLIYDQHHFVQVLEGAEADVRAIFDKIVGDRRHTGIEVLETAEVAERRFPYWWMAAGPIDTDLSLFRTLSGDRFDPRQHSAAELIELIETVLAAQMQQPVAVTDFGKVARRA